MHSEQQPAATPIEVLDAQGQAVARLDVTSREAILLQAAVVDQEDNLAQRFNPQTVTTTQLQLRQILNGAITRGCSQSDLVSLETDPEAAAWHYVVNVRGTVPRHPVLGSSQEGSDGAAKAADDAVAVSPDELFGDDDDDGTEISLSAGALDIDARDIEDNAGLSRRYRDKLQAEIEAAQNLVLPVESARIALLALRRQIAGLPSSEDGLRMELQDVEHKVADCIPEPWLSKSRVEFRMPFGRYASLVAAAVMARLTR